MAGSILACLAAGALLSGTVGAEVIDRLIAIVGTRGITLSDLRAATELGFIEPAGGSEADTVRATVDRMLMLQEVERYGPGAPDDAVVTKRLAEIEERLGKEGLARLMAVAGLDAPRLRALVVEDLELSRYLADRFGAAAQPTDDEVQRYYLEHPEQFSRQGTVQPFDEVEDEARAALSARRRKQLIDQWREGLRRRADVRVLWPASARP